MNDKETLSPTSELVKIAASYADLLTQSNTNTKELVKAAAKVISAMTIDSSSAINESVKIIGQIAKHSIVVSDSCVEELSKVLSTQIPNNVSPVKNVTLTTGVQKIHISLSDFIALFSIVITIIFELIPDQTEALLEEQNRILQNQNQLLCDYIDSATSEDLNTQKILEDVKNSLRAVRYSAERLSESVDSSNTDTPEECNSESKLEE